MAGSGDAAAPSSTNRRINIKVKTLGQASYDLEVAEDVSVLGLPIPLCLAAACIPDHFSP